MAARLGPQRRLRRIGFPLRSVLHVVVGLHRRWRPILFSFSQPIEADMVTDFAWGTPNAQPVTLVVLGQF